MSCRAGVGECGDGLWYLCWIGRPEERDRQHQNRKDNESPENPLAVGLRHCHHSVFVYMPYFDLHATSAGLAQSLMLGFFFTRQLAAAAAHLLSAARGRHWLRTVE